MEPTGTVRDGGRTLVLTRRFAAPIKDVWASLTESERLGRWFATWSGDPASGSVLVHLNAEPESEEAPATPCEIRACEPPRLLAVRTSDEQGEWWLTVELSEAEGGTTLELRHEQLEPGTAAEIGAGWEWYLDRLVAAMTDTPPPTLGDFETLYMPMARGYAEMT